MGEGGNRADDGLKLKLYKGKKLIGKLSFMMTEHYIREAFSIFGKIGVRLKMLLINFIQVK